MNEVNGEGVGDRSVSPVIYNTDQGVAEAASHSLILFSSKTMPSIFGWFRVTWNKAYVSQSPVQLSARLAKS